MIHECDVIGCSTCATWKLKSPIADADLLTWLCLAHWRELRSYNWRAACAYWPMSHLQGSDEPNPKGNGDKHAPR